MIAAGVVIGAKFKLVSPIGEGGMGSVWRAEHMSLGRPLAIKFIRPEANSPDVSARFLREARATAAIRHRNVIDVIDYGTTDEGLPYIVMELLEGSNLSARLKSDPPVSLADLFEYVAAALNGLATVHDKGIIHRDLKPDNIFLANDPDGIVPKIVDFGISRSNLGATGEEARLTMTGSVLGTPFYMSPEQIRGVKDIDARTDLYSMGVILYEALAGRVPFSADTLGGLMIAIATEEPPPLSRLREDIPPEVAGLVAKSMARDREERFQNAREMRQAILALAKTVKGEARRTSPPAAIPPVGGVTPPTRIRVPTAPGTPAAWASTIPPKPSPRRPWLLPASIGGGVLVVAAVALAIVLGGSHRGAPEVARRAALAPAPAPDEAHVTIHLRRVPAEAEIHVDGTLARDPDVRLPRDSREHVVTVTAAGYSPFVVHPVANSDGEYTVALDPLAAPAAGTPASPGGAVAAATAPQEAASPAADSSRSAHHRPATPSHSRSRGRPNASAPGRPQGGLEADPGF